MARLEDPAILALYRSALANWRCTGYVEWKQLALLRMRNELGENDPRNIAQLMFEHVETGGEIDQVIERRPEWNDYPFHYDLRITVAGRRLYIETILLDDDPDDSIILVVSIHDA